MITYLWTELTGLEFGSSFLEAAAKSIWVALIAGGLPIWRLLRVSAVTVGGYKRRHLATLKSAPLLNKITLLDCLLHCFGCNLHLRQDTCAASFKNKIQRLIEVDIGEYPSKFYENDPKTKTKGSWNVATDS
ncbi:hypothetical protein L2E82_12882 [Cichorium intybus]|uniref:Uncharacterized protein n=1 Tax=Cichorium intybus TaxID=13427 RepID=A0ACB9GII0_CICIN|nr:hypothetical protein L2E82_12882 [Cichorium intybus]